MTPEIRTKLSYQSVRARCCLGARAEQGARAEGPAGPRYRRSATAAGPAAADEAAWLRALHAVELCQEVAELAARR
jgi:hypothetical protein